MFTTEEKWSAVGSFATTVMKRLREEKPERRKKRRLTTTVPRNKEKTKNVEELNN